MTGILVLIDRNNHCPLLSTAFCADIKQISTSSFSHCFVQNGTLFNFYFYLFLLAHVAFEMLQKEKETATGTERWNPKSEKARILKACCFHLSHIIHLPSINKSITSPERTVFPSKLKVTLWWAPPSRPWCVCVRVCEMDWRTFKRGPVLASRSWAA